MQVEPTLSSPSPADLDRWRVFLEVAFALPDILDAELQAERGISLRWYDALVHLEDTLDGLRMNELAGRILASKSGLTRVVDRMEEAGLVRRERPRNDRRVIQVLITDAGRAALARAREVDHRGIQEHFLDQLHGRDLGELTAALEKVRDHARPLRPGRISG